MYRPHNPKNYLITKDDVKRILLLLDIQYTPTNIDFFRKATTHTSYVARSIYTDPAGNTIELEPTPSGCLELQEESYERQEWFGDSALGYHVARYLFKRFPDEEPGTLTEIKKIIVCNEMLGSICEKIGLSKFYIISKHNEEICNGRKNLHKLGDILEAFIAALELDSCDPILVGKFIVKLIETYVDIGLLLRNNQNFKQQWQNICQEKFKYTPTYISLSSSLNEFTEGVVNAKKEIQGTGTASTKKQAQQLAAKQALSKLA